MEHRLTEQISRLLPEFIAIPAVPFLIGTPEQEHLQLARAYGGTRESYREEGPQHTLELPAFSIARTPVTNALYALFVAATNSRSPINWHGPQPAVETLFYPVTDLSWAEALAFCAWLSGPTIQYRLPTEAEWEHMARGSDGRRFPWGAEWNQAYARTRESGLNNPGPVGAYPAGASPYGCLDVAGTVWEWTSSLDHRYPYDPHDGREDLQAPGRRILRGGCYANPHGYARCSCRFRLPPTIHNEFLGFRLVKAEEP